MATSSWEDIINAIPDESDQSQIANLAERYPEVKSGWLRQSDYSRKLDELKPIRDDLAKWESWAASNWDDENNAPKLEVYWRNRAKELEASKGDEMTFDDISKWAQDNGVVTKDTLKHKEDEFLNSINGTAYFALAAADLQGRHIEEFGKPMKVRDFAAKMAEAGVNDPDAFFDRYVADQRSERLKLEREKELEEARAAEREKVRREMAEKQMQSKGQYPMTDEAPQMGHFEAKVRKIADPEAAQKAELGDNTLSMLAAQDYRKKQSGLSE